MTTSLTLPCGSAEVESQNLSCTTAEPVEIWEDIAGFEGLYQISHSGYVRSMKRGTPKILAKDHHFGGKRVPEAFRYYLTLNGKTYKMTDKFLMALTFVGPRPSLDHNAILIDNNKPLSPTNVMWRHKRFSTMPEKLMCPNGHLMMTSKDYYTSIFERTGHKRCRICHRGHVHANIRRRAAKRKRERSQKV